MRKFSQPSTWLFLGLVLALCLGLAGSLFWLSQKNASVRVQSEIQYGLINHQPLLLDIYLPQTPTTAKRPGVILVHGGGWLEGDKKDFADLARGLADKGYLSFSVNYRLVTADANKFPTQIEDVQRAVRWIRAHAAEYNLDGDRLCAIGSSAGGQLVALLGTTDTRDNRDASLAAYSSRVNCVVAIAAPADLTTPLIVKTGAEGAVINLIGQSRLVAPQIYREASPIFQIDEKTVPFLIFHGEFDSLVPVDQARRFEAALKRAGIEAELVVFAGEGHGFTQEKNIQLFIAKLDVFLQKHLKSSG